MCVCKCSSSFHNRLVNLHAVSVCNDSMSNIKFGMITQELTATVVAIWA